MINLDAAARSAIYPGVQEAVAAALRLHNPAAPHIAGRDAAAARYDFAARIGSVLGCDPDSICSAESCTSIFARLAKTLEWSTAEFEHSSNIKYAARVESEHTAEFLSVFNHESGARVAEQHSPVYTDITGSDLRTISDLSVFSLGKHGGGPGGILIDRTKSISADWGPGNICVLAAAAAALDYAASIDGIRRESELPGIKSIFIDLASKLGWQVVAGDSNRMLTVITPFPTDLFVSVSEEHQLITSGGAACNSGLPVKNAWVAKHFGELAATRCVRLSWDLTMTPHIAAEAARRLLSVNTHLSGFSG